MEKAPTKLVILLVTLIILFPINLGVCFYLGYNTAFKKIQNLGPYFLPKEAVVVKVIDGDTIEITSPNKIGSGLDRVSSRSVRYLGIDAPNPGEKNYKESKVANERLVLGKTVKLEYDTPQNDKYGRILAWVWLEDKIINKEMVKNGLAKPYIVEGQNLKYKF